MDYKAAIYSNPMLAQFRTARTACCLLHKATSANATSPCITLPFSVTVHASIQTALPTVGIFAPKSYAQVETSVSPQVVSPKSGELKLDHGCVAFRKEKRRNPLTVRLSDAERAIIEAKAKATGCTTNGFVRAAALSSDYKPVRDADLTKALLSINREFTAQGNNLNQIAKHLNGGTASPAEADGMLGIIARSMLQTHKTIRAALAHGEEPHP